MTNITVKNELQARIENGTILGMEVIGVDGCQEPYNGVIKELTVYNHSVLGLLCQAWVEWENNIGNLTPYFPRQFQKWEGKEAIGVYYKCDEGEN